MTPTLTVDALTKRYGQTVALDSVSVDLVPGEVTVLVGRSGAGKTTLLRCVNGLETPDEGTVQYDGEPLAPPDVALVFQGGALTGRKTALENTLDGGLARESRWRELFGWHAPAEKRAAVTRLHDVGLAGMADRRVRTLSGGERQRVGVARALHQQPVVLLADEPVASLDPATARAILALLADAIREHDLVGLISLHQPTLASDIADRYLGLTDGQITLDTSATDVSDDDIAMVYE